MRWHPSLESSRLILTDAIEYWKMPNPVFRVGLGKSRQGFNGVAEDLPAARPGIERKSRLALELAPECGWFGKALPDGGQKGALPGAVLHDEAVDARANRSEQ